MKVKIVVMLFLLFCSSAKAQSTFSKPPKFIFGTWEIYRHEYTSRGTLITANRLKSYIGKKVTFAEKSFSHDKDFLFFDDECDLRKYTFETFKGLEGEVGKTQGTLWMFGKKESQKNKIQWIKPNCGGQDMYYFEITKNKELAIFYDSYFFFLRKAN